MGVAVVIVSRFGMRFFGAPIVCMDTVAEMYDDHCVEDYGAGCLDDGVDHLFDRRSYVQ